MINLQLIDSADGGYFGFERNDYPIDEGLYTEMYAALFATSSAEWLLDNAFSTISENISSRTGIALKANASISETNLNLIKKAVSDDMLRFTNKNKGIDISEIAIAYWSKTILIIIEVKGFDKAFNFTYSKTQESLENANFKIY